MTTSNSVVSKPLPKKPEMFDRWQRMQSYALPDPEEIRLKRRLMNLSSKRRPSGGSGGGPLATSTSSRRTSQPHSTVSRDVDHHHHHHHHHHHRHDQDDVEDDFYSGQQRLYLHDLPVDIKLLIFSFIPVVAHEMVDDLRRIECILECTDPTALRQPVWHKESLRSLEEAIKTRHCQHSGEAAVIATAMFTREDLMVPTMSALQAQILQRASTRAKVLAQHSGSLWLPASGAMMMMMVAAAGMTTNVSAQPRKVTSPSKQLQQPQKSPTLHASNAVALVSSAPAASSSSSFFLSRSAVVSYLIHQHEQRQRYVASLTIAMREVESQKKTAAAVAEWISYRDTLKHQTCKDAAPTLRSDLTLWRSFLYKAATTAAFEVANIHERRVRDGIYAHEEQQEQQQQQKIRGRGNSVSRDVWGTPQVNTNDMSTTSMASISSLPRAGANPFAPLAEGQQMALTSFAADVACQLAIEECDHLLQQTSALEYLGRPDLELADIHNLFWEANLTVPEGVTETYAQTITTSQAEVLGLTAIPWVAGYTWEGRNCGSGGGSNGMPSGPTSAATPSVLKELQAMQAIVEAEALTRAKNLELARLAAVAEATRAAEVKAEQRRVAAKSTAADRMTQRLVSVSALVDPDRPKPPPLYRRQWTGCDLCSQLPVHHVGLARDHRRREPLPSEFPAPTPFGLPVESSLILSSTVGSNNRNQAADASGQRSMNTTSTAGTTTTEDASAVGPGAMSFSAAMAGIEDDDTHTVLCDRCFQEEYVGRPVLMKLYEWYVLKELLSEGTVPAATSMTS